jgi:hypothetical protein
MRRNKGRIDRPGHFGLNRSFENLSTFDPKFSSVFRE